MPYIIGLLERLEPMLEQLGLLGMLELIGLLEELAGWTGLESLE